MEHDLIVCVACDAGRVTVAVTGELDLATVGMLRARLAEVAKATTGDVVVDLAGLTFMDCVGLSAIVGVDEELSAAGRLLLLRHPSAAATTVLSITGADAHLRIESAGP